MRGLVQLGPSGLIFIGVLISAIGALWASKQQTKFERDLRTKSEEIADLNREIASLVTGGDSFCYLAIGSIDPKTNRGIPIVLQQGDHPIFDVDMRIVDLEKFSEIRDYTLAKLSEAQTVMPIGNLAKGTGMTLEVLELGDCLERRFNIFFVARNGQFTQNLRLRKLDEKWVQATKVERDGKIIFEKIDEDFPRSEEGKVQW